jgi:hypothetical protein
MITRIGRGDVVRITRTGEVGTVAGWADRDRLARRGTIIDVRVSNEKTIQANGRALELVALAKLQASALATWSVVAVALALAGVSSYRLYQDGTDLFVTVCVGLMMYTGLDRTLTALFLRKRTRVNLPVDYTTVPGQKAKSRPPVGKS